MGLSYTLWEAIHMMEILKEMKCFMFPVTEPNTDVPCHVFEDNSGEIEMAWIYKFRPRTKHVNYQSPSFSILCQKRRGVHTCHKAAHQIADYLTKPLNAEQLCKLREMVMGW